MSVVQLVAVALVSVFGTVVACTHDPLRQTLLLGIYGIALTFFFFAVQAPDVALSEIVVSTVGLPVIIFATLRKLSEQEGDREEDEQP